MKYSIFNSEKGKEKLQKQKTQNPVEGLTCTVQPFTLEQRRAPREPDHIKSEAKIRCLQKQIRMQKLKIAAVSAESGGELGLKSPEEDDLGNDMYKREQKKELGTAACVTRGSLPSQRRRVQQVKLLLLYKIRNDPGNLGQIAAGLGPQKASTSVN